MLSPYVKRLAVLDRRRELFLATVRSASEAQRAFRPTPASWSMLDVTEHLVLAEEKSLLGMMKGPPPGMTVTPLARVRMAMVRVVLQSALRVKVPVARVLPQGDATLPELEARWMEARRGLERFLESLGEADTGAARFRHPIGGWVTAEAGLGFYAGHIDHHARQLRRICRSTGYPRS